MGQVDGNPIFSIDFDFAPEPAELAGEPLKPAAAAWTLRGDSHLACPGGITDPHLPRPLAGVVSQEP
jgi:hypothetical protein